MTTAPTIDPIVHGTAVSLRMDEMQEWKVAAYLEKNARGAVKRQQIRKLKLYWWTDREIVRLAYMRSKDYCEAKLGYLLAKRNKATRFADWSDDFRAIVASFASEIYEEMAWDELAAKHRKEKQA